MSNESDDGAARRQSPLASLQRLLARNKPHRPLRLSEDHVLSLIFVRRARGALLGANLFSDPAWDILLELYAANLGKRTVLLRELAVATETPLSTTRRWVAALKERNLVSVTTEAAAPDWVQVELTEEAITKLERLGDQWGSAFVSI